MQPISRWELATSTRVTTDANKLVNGSLIRHNNKLLFTQGRLKDFINGVAQEEPRTKCRQTRECLIGNIYIYIFVYLFFLTWKTGLEKNWFYLFVQLCALMHMVLYEKWLYTRV